MNPNENVSQHYSVTKFSVGSLKHHVFDHPIPNGGEGAFLFQHAFAASYGGDSPNSLCSNTTRPDTLDPPGGSSQEYSFVEWDPDESPTQPNAKISAPKVDMKATKPRATGKKATENKTTEKKATGKKATMNDRERRSAKSTVEGELKKQGKGRKTSGKGKKTDGKKKRDEKKKTAEEKGTGGDAGDSMALDSQHCGRSDDMPPPAQVAPGSSGATRAPTASQADPAVHGSPYSSLGKDVAPGARPATLAVPPQGWSDYPHQEDIAAASAAAPTQTTVLPVLAQASYQDPHFYAGSRPTPAAWEHTTVPAISAQGWNQYPHSNEQMALGTNTYRPADAFAVVAQGRQYSPYPDETMTASAAAPVHSAALPVAVQSQHYSPLPFPVPTGATWQQAAEIASLQQDWYQTSSQTNQRADTEEVAWTPTAGFGVPVQGEDYGLLTDDGAELSAEAVALETVAHGGYSYPRTDEELGPTDAYVPTYAPTTPGLERDRESSSDDGLLTPPEQPTVDGLLEPWWALSDKDVFARIFAHRNLRKSDGLA